MVEQERCERDMGCKGETRSREGYEKGGYEGSRLRQQIGGEDACHAQLGQCERGLAATDRPVESTVMDGWWWSMD